MPSVLLLYEIVKFYYGIVLFCYEIEKIEKVYANIATL